MKYASFKYDVVNTDLEDKLPALGLANLGDNIQTLAAEQFIPSVDKKFHRDYLKYSANAEPYILIMNGWFSKSPHTSLPAHESIKPVFIGFHISKSASTLKTFLKSEYIDYFRRFEPIGCRDKQTAEYLSSKGIQAFYSKCLTLTFPSRKETPKDGKVFIVDASDIPIPNSLRKEACFVTHFCPDFYGDEIKTLMASKLLDYYRKKAKLVITTRLHCAMPCLAMGIPVIFFGDPNSYRLSILQDLGLKINQLPSQSTKLAWKFYSKINKHNTEQTFLNGVNWNPPSLNIEQEKQKLIKTTKELLSKRLSSS